MDHVAAKMPSDIDLLPFSYRAALTGDWTVLHLHWPESLLRHPSRLARVKRAGLLLALLARLRFTRRFVVRTLHNIEPHESGRRYERLLLELLDRRVDAHVRLNPLSKVRSGTRLLTIPHGHYREQFADGQRTSRQPRHLLYFGFIRPYKGVAELVAAFGELDDPAARLTIAGLPSDPGFAAQLREQAVRDKRVTMRLEFVPDDELSGLLQASAVAVLPAPRVHNSGGLIAALSADRPALVARSEVSEHLQAELGAEWIRLFTPPLTPSDLREALDEAKTFDAASSPDLSGRSWGEVAAAYAELYRSLTGAALSV